MIGTVLLGRMQRHLRRLMSDLVGSKIQAMSWNTIYVLALGDTNGITCT